MIVENFIKKVSEHQAVNLDYIRRDEAAGHLDAIFAHRRSPKITRRFRLPRLNTVMFNSMSPRADSFNSAQYFNDFAIYRTSHAASPSRNLSGNRRAALRTSGERGRLLRICSLANSPCLPLSVLSRITVVVCLTMGENGGEVSVDRVVMTIRTSTRRIAALNNED